MQNNSLKYDYVKRILIYLIIGISAFQFPLIFTNNATGFEAKFLNALNSSAFTRDILDFISPFLTKFSISVLILFRSIGAIFVAVSVALLYKTLLEKEDISCLTVTTLLLLFNPITQIIFILAIPFSVTLFASMAILKVYIDKAIGYKVKIGILIFLSAVIVTSTSVIDIHFLCMNLLVIISPFFAYIVGVKLYKYSKPTAFILVVIFITLSALIKVSPKIYVGADILYDDRDMKGVASFLYQNLTNERYLLAENIYDGELIKYYTRANLSVAKYDKGNVTLPAMILSKEALDMAELSNGADAKMVGIYSITGKNRSLKYFIYSVK